jgi:hypothetical protein
VFVRDALRSGAGENKEVAAFVCLQEQRKATRWGKKECLLIRYCSFRCSSMSCHPRSTANLCCPLAKRFVRGFA